MNWDAVAAIAQGVEAFVVLVGGIAIFYQLRQFRTEQMHSKWEALRWAVSVVSVEDINVVSDMAVDSMGFDLKILGPATSRLMEGLELVSTAIHDGYVNKESFFRMRARDLSILAPNKLRMQPRYREKVLLSVEPRFEDIKNPGANLLREAWTWQERKDSE